MGSGDDTKAEQGGSVAANRYLRRAVDKCLGDGIEREQVAEALVRMAETVHSEIAEERAEYRRRARKRRTASTRCPSGNECACGWVYSAEHQKTDDARRRTAAASRQPPEAAAETPCSRPRLT